MRRGRYGNVDLGPPPARALSQFVAVNARSGFRLPAPLLGAAGGIAGFAGMQTFVTALAGAGIGVVVGLAIQGPRLSLIDRLDRQRRFIGLERALSREQIDALEPSALDWERIENAMQSEAWRGQPDYQSRVSAAAKRLMEQLVGSVLRDRKKPSIALELRQLGVAVDRVSASMGAYERPQFDSSGVPIDEGLPAVADLAELLRTIEGVAA